MILDITSRRLIFRVVLGSQIAVSQHNKIKKLGEHLYSSMNIKKVEAFNKLLRNFH